MQLQIKVTSALGVFAPTFRYAAAMVLAELLQGQRIAVYFYVAMSAITFIVFGFDKLAAQRSRRRVPEKTLHLLSLLGGWPGALIAMQVLRHKRQKWSFAVVVWMIAVGHSIFIAWYFSRRF